MECKLKFNEREYPSKVDKYFLDGGKWGLTTSLTLSSLKLISKSRVF